MNRPIFIQQLRTNNCLNMCLYRLQETRLVEGGKLICVSLYFEVNKTSVSSCGVWALSELSEPHHTTQTISQSQSQVRIFSYLSSFFSLQYLNYIHLHFVYTYSSKLASASLKPLSLCLRKSFSLFLSHTLNQVNPNYLLA